MGTIFNIVVPVFGIVLTGYLAGRMGILGNAAASILNRFVFFFALPPLTFTFTANAPVGQILNWPFIGAFLGGTLLSFALAIIGGRWVFGYRGPVVIVHGLAATFANTAYMGIPLFLTAYGSAGAMPAIIASLCNLLLIGLAIAVIDTISKGSPSTTRIARDIGAATLRNPMLVAAALGMVFSATGLSVPPFIANYLDLMGRIASPGALFAIGLHLVGQPLKSDIAEVGWTAAVKLFMHPIVVWLLATYVFEMSDQWRTGAILLAAMPSGALVYVVAQRFNIYVARASGVILVTTAVSILTLSALLVRFLNP